MNREQAKAVINKLLHEIEEEDVGISLLNMYSQSPSELDFFKEGDREKIISILKTLSEDSRRHKGILVQIIDHLERKCRHAE